MLPLCRVSIAGAAILITDQRLSSVLGAVAIGPMHRMEAAGVEPATACAYPEMPFGLRAWDFRPQRSRSLVPRIAGAG